MKAQEIKIFNDADNSKGIIDDRNLPACDIRPAGCFHQGFIDDNDILFARSKIPSGSQVDLEDFQEMLVDSVRTWGGKYRDDPIYVVVIGPKTSGLRIMDKNVELVSLELSV